MRSLTIWTVRVVAAIVLVENFGPLLSPMFLRGVAPVSPTQVLAAAVETAPAAFYLWGLWCMSGAFERLSGADPFAPQISVTLERVGKALLGGALMSLVGVPTLLRLLGDGPPYLVALDVGAFTLTIMGLALAVFANLLRRAHKLQADLQDII